MRYAELEIGVDLQAGLMIGGITAYARGSRMLRLAMGGISTWFIGSECLPWAVAQRLIMRREIDRRDVGVYVEDPFQSFGPGQGCSG